MINLEYLQGLGDESRLRPNLFMIPLPALLDARALNAPYEAEINLSGIARVDLCLSRPGRRHIGGWTVSFIHDELYYPSKKLEEEGNNAPPELEESAGVMLKAVWYDIEAQRQGFWERLRGKTPELIAVRRSLDILTDGNMIESSGYIGTQVGGLADIVVQDVFRASETHINYTASRGEGSNFLCLENLTPYNLAHLQIETREKK